MTSESTTDDRSIMLLESTIAANDSHEEPGKSPRQLHNIKKTITVLLCLGFLGLGACISIPGPTLSALGENTNTSLSQTSWVFTTRSMGYLIGSVIGGMLFDSFDHLILMGIAMFASAIPSGMIPWCHNLIMLSSLTASQGISMGFLDSGGNVVCIQTWGPKSPTALQTLHFFFGFGAFLAPILTGPFLKSEELKSNVFSNSVTQNSSTQLYVSRSLTSVTSSLKPNSLYGEVKSSAFSMSVTQATSTQLYVNKTQWNVTSSLQSDTSTDFFCWCSIRCPYMGIALFLILVGTFIFALRCYIQCVRLNYKPGFGSVSDKEVHSYDTSQFQELVLLFLLSMFFFLYVGMEVTYGGLVASFSEREFLVSQKTGALITSTFWAAFSVGRFVSIFMAHRMSPMAMLAYDLLASVIALILLTVTKLIKTTTIAIPFLYFSSGLLGLGMSSIFPAGVSWVGSYIKLTGKYASVFVVGSALGEMALPIIAAHLMVIDNFYFMYFLLAGATLSLLLLGGMAYLAHRMLFHNIKSYARVETVGINEESVSLFSIGNKNGSIDTDDEDDPQEHDQILHTTCCKLSDEDV